jgi:hypothetical protein
MARTRTKLAVVSAATAATLAVGLAIPAQSQALNVPYLVGCVDSVVAALTTGRPIDAGCQLPTIIQQGLGLPSPI